MKTFILDASVADDPVSMNIAQYLRQLLEEGPAPMTHIRLAGQDMQGCIGCLKCFFESPGECVFNDIARELPRLFIDSQLAVFISPVTFGGFSALFAKAYNRMMIQLESHLAETAGGELRRKKRYGTVPPVLFWGLAPAPDPESEKIFIDLARSNAFRHLQTPAHGVAFFSSEDTGDDIQRRIRASIESIRS